MIQTIHPPLTVIPHDVRPDEVFARMQVLADTGFDVVGIPFDSLDRAQSVRLVACAFGDRALIGAGTMLRSENVNLTVMVGSKLVATSSTHVSTVRATAQAGFVICIGCMAVTEAFAMPDVDTQVLKILPTGTLGPDYVHAFKVMLPAEVPVFAIGGITSENLADYLIVGCIGAGLDSDLHRPSQPVGRAVGCVRALVTAYRST